MPLRYCAVRFASKFPSWRLHTGGGVADLVAGVGEDVGIVHDPDGIEVDWAHGSGGGLNEYH